MKVKQARKIVRNPSFYPDHLIQKAIRQLAQSTFVDGEIVYDGRATFYPNKNLTDFESVAKEVQRLTYFYGPVRFTFEEVEMISFPGESLTEILENYLLVADETYAERVETKFTKAQQSIPELMKQLPQQLDDITKTVRWFDEFMEFIDYKELYSKNELLYCLEKAGYQANEYVLDEKAADYQIQQTILESDPIQYGRYLIGQVMSCFDDGTIPCPVLWQYFSEKYHHLLGRAA